MARLLFLFCICFYSILNKIKAQTTSDLTLDISPTIDEQWNGTSQTDHPSQQTSATIKNENTATTVGPSVSLTSTSPTARSTITSTTTTTPATTSQANNLVKTINGLLFPLYLIQYFIGKHY